jgi:hypothetical protein
MSKPTGDTMETLCPRFSHRIKNYYKYIFIKEYVILNEFGWKKTEEKRMENRWQTGDFIPPLFAKLPEALFSRTRL